MTGHATNLDELIAGLRPQLYRYCARMVGSAVDGEDIVQDAALKAVAAWGAVGPTENPAGWLFRIAHNTALDFLRRRQRIVETSNAEVLGSVAAPDLPDFDTAAVALRIFLRMPALQRSAVILKDVLGHSLQEVTAITGVSEPAARSALQRGRVRLRSVASEPEEVALPALTRESRLRLAKYVDGFRTGDFDAVRAMLAEDVRLDLVGKATLRGRAGVSEYYSRYAECDRWIYAAGVVEGRPAMLAYDRERSSTEPAHFAALGFHGDRIGSIHDFLFAHYGLECVDIVRLAGLS